MVRVGFSRKAAVALPSFGGGCGGDSAAGLDCSVFRGIRTAIFEGLGGSA